MEENRLKKLFSELPTALEYFLESICKDCKNNCRYYYLISDDFRRTQIMLDWIDKITLATLDTMAQNKSIKLYRTVLNSIEEVSKYYRGEEIVLLVKLEDIKKELEV